MNQDPYLFFPHALHPLNELLHEIDTKNPQTFSFIPSSTLIILVGQRVCIKFDQNTNGLDQGKSKLRNRIEARSVQYFPFLVAVRLSGLLLNLMTSYLQTLWRLIASIYSLAYFFLGLNIKQEMEDMKHNYLSNSKVCNQAKL